MIPEHKVREVVAAHARLDEPTAAAIWIRQDDPSGVWLVEVIPSLTDEERAEEPVFFAPGVEFAFSLALIAGNRTSLEEALQRNREFARAVAEGEVLLDASGDASALKRLALSLSPPVQH